jgi:outer membrane lipoprotein-sorting protein
MNQRSLCVALAVLTLVVTGLSSARGQSAKAIVEKSNAVVGNAKTYQAMEKMQMSLGALGSTTLIVDMKIIPGKKANMKTSADPNAKGTGQMAMLSAALSQHMWDDGKNVYVYMPAFNKFVKEPHGAQSKEIDPPGLIKLEEGTCKLLAPETIEGRPMYVVSGKPAGGGAGALGIQMQTAVMYIDKATYHIKRVKMTGSVQGQQVTITLETVSEKLNAPIPASVFVFTPPSGATAMQGGLGGMMGGMGGAGGMRPGQ